MRLVISSPVPSYNSKYVFSIILCGEEAEFRIIVFVIQGGKGVNGIKVHTYFVLRNYCGTLLLA